MVAAFPFSACPHQGERRQRSFAALRFVLVVLPFAEILLKRGIVSLRAERRGFEPSDFLKIDTAPTASQQRGEQTSLPNYHAVRLPSIALPAQALHVVPCMRATFTQWPNMIQFRCALMRSSTQPLWCWLAA